MRSSLVGYVYIVYNLKRHPTIRNIQTSKHSKSNACFVLLLFLPFRRISNETWKHLGL